MSKPTVAKLAEQMQQQNEKNDKRFDDLFAKLEQTTDAIARVIVKEQPIEVPPALTQDIPTVHQPVAQVREQFTFNSLQELQQAMQAGLIPNLVQPPAPPKAYDPAAAGITPVAPPQPLVTAPMQQPQMQMQQQQHHIPQQQAPYNRQQAGSQSRSSNCACCNQKRRTGTIDLRTNEYIASGLTTAWLQQQQGIIVTLSAEGHAIPHQVSGQWLSDELKKREYDPITNKRGRATSVPGFLCGEASSQNPRIRLQQPILRRATDDEEEQQYKSRLLKATLNCFPQLAAIAKKAGLIA